MTMISINGVDLPAPSTFVVVTEDLEGNDTVRNEEGYLQRDRIRQDIYTIELEYNVKKGNEIHLIESAISSKRLMVRFPDTAGHITREMYVAGKDKEMVLYKDGVVDDMRWNLTFTLHEY